MHSKANHLIGICNTVSDVLSDFLLARRYASAGIGLCYGNSVCLSVCLCVTRVLCIKTAKCFIEFILRPDSPIILVSRHRGSLLNSDGFTPNGGAEYKGDETIGRFLTNKLVYLRNDTRYGHSCYRSRNRNHTRATEWCYFWWPWVTPTQVSRSSYSSKANISQTWRRAGFSTVAELGLVSHVCVSDAKLWHTGGRNSCTSHVTDKCMPCKELYKNNN